MYVIRNKDLLFYSNMDFKSLEKIYKQKLVKTMDVRVKVLCTFDVYVVLFRHLKKCAFLL